MPTSHPDIADILNQAVAIESPVARETFLAQACRDDASLKARVEELVRMHFLAGDFLEHPAVETAATLSNPHFSLKIGTRIGPYKLLQEIGEGGMGVVYMAQQDEPVKRRVALKVIKPGMDSRQVIARFEAERQALAMMDHPNIARVFDAGVTDSGRPYFVMELINGVPITRYCDEQHLTPHERLRLFLPVCHAVQHAHQKGVIHRDLKPSNVLVACYDNLAIPKVIDFGVAKATNQQLTDLTLFTEFGQVMGTFEYMSPEQASRNQLDVDTRTDVYSLGVILYELLTGETPFDATRFRRAAIDEILKIIGDEDPPRPSLRLSGGQSLASIAANRRIEPARLSRFMRGDLDWIVMRSLEKDRARRYATVGSLAADVQRFMNDEPVEAGPPSTTYRLRKFARRNTGLCVSASLIAMLLLLGTVISTWLAIRAIRAEHRAEELAIEANRSADDARDALGIADWQRMKALETANEARRSRYHSHLLMASGAAENNRAGAAIDWLEMEIPQPGHPDARTFGWYYLRSQCQRELATFFGHSGRVWGAAFSPDGGTLATAGADHTIRLWNVTGQNEAQVLRGHQHEVNAVAFSPDGRLLVSVSDDLTIRVWNPATGAPLAVVTGHHGNVRAAVFSPDGETLVTAGSDTTIKFWNVADWREIGEMTGHSDEINQLSFSPDGTRIASCADDETVRIWDVATRQEVAVLSGHSNHVRGVAFSPDGDTIASGARDGTVRLWNAETYQQIDEFNEHSKGVGAIAFSPDGSVLASVGEDLSIQFWKVGSGHVLGRVFGHSGRLFGAAYSPDGRLLASTSLDSTVKLWEAPDPSRLLLEGHRSAVFAVAFSPDGRRLASAGWDDGIKLWDTQTGEELRTLTQNKAGLNSFVLSPRTSIVYSPDGRTLASADGTGSIQLWDTETGELFRKRIAHREAVRQIAFSTDGTLLASCSQDRTVKVWRMPALEAVATLAGHQDQVETVAFFPGSDRLASAGRDTTIRIWDLNSQAEQMVLAGAGGPVNSVDVSPDGRTVASGCEDGDIRFWDASTGDLQAAIGSQARAIESLAYSPDGAFLVSGSDDGTVSLWDLETQLEIDSFHGHTAQTNNVSLSRDGTRLATASCDTTVRLWEIRTAPGWNPLNHQRFRRLSSRDE